MQSLETGDFSFYIEKYVIFACSIFYSPCPEINLGYIESEICLERMLFGPSLKTLVVKLTQLALVAGSPFVSLQIVFELVILARSGNVQFA